MSKPNDEFPVESGIPMPTSRTKYPWHDLEVGESFFVPGKESRQLSGCVRIIKEKKFTMRKRTQDGIAGVRIWRTK